jgi:hypothetical protein
MTDAPVDLKAEAWEAYRQHGSRLGACRFAFDWAWDAAMAARTPVEAGVVTREEHGDPLDPETGEPVPHTGGSTHYECYACELVNSPYGARYESRPAPPGRLDTVTDSPVDLDDAESIILESMSADDRQLPHQYRAACRMLEAIIAELRAARAVGQGASEHAKCQRDEAGDCVAHAEEDPACLMNAPPADEVAGLTRDLDAVRDAISFARSKLNGYTTLGLDLTYALDRLENHLKGKR